MSANTVLVVLSMAALLLVAVFSRIYFQSWLKPGAFFPLMVSLVFIPSLIFASSYYVYAGALLWVVVSVMCFSSGSMLVSLKYQSRLPKSLDEDSSNGRYRNFKSSDILRSITPMLAVSIALGLLSSFLLIWFYGRSVTLFFSSKAIGEIGHNLSVIRYGGNGSPPLLSQILLAFVYSSPILGGVSYARGGARISRVLSILSLLPAFVVFLIQTTRAAPLFAVALWATSYFAYKVFLGRGVPVPLFTKRRALVLVVVLFSFVLISSIGPVFRTSEVPTAGNVISGIRSPDTTATLFGHVSAYSREFQEVWAENEKPTYGSITFAGIVELTASNSNVPLKVWYFPDGTRTTIDTIFASLLKDFGYSGSLVFLFALGVISSLIYEKVSRGKFLLVPLLSALFLFVGLIIGSIFKYTTIILAFLIVQAYFVAAWIHVNPRSARAKAGNK